MTNATSACAPARCAVIDIGSNTTRLLVAEPDPRRPGALVEVAAHRAFVRLTAAERRSGIPAAKAEAIAEAVAEQALTARANDVSALRVVATAALRDAPGRDALLARLGAAAGVPGRRPAWWASLPIGSGALAEAHLHGDPPTPAELRATRAEADAALAAAGCPAADVAWAVGGSATSLRRLCGERLTAPALEQALVRVTAAPAAEVALDLDLHVERVRLLPAGLVLLAAVAAAAQCPLHVGCGGLREGVVLDLLGEVG